MRKASHAEFCSLAGQVASMEEDLLLLLMDTPYFSYPMAFLTIVTYQVHWVGSNCKIAKIAKLQKSTKWHKNVPPKAPAAALIHPAVGAD